MEGSVISHQIGKDVLYKTWHASKEHLFMYFYSDGGSIVCAEHVFPIKKGTLVFIAAEAYHYTMPDDPARYDRSKLILSQTGLHKIFDLLGRDNRVKNLSDKAIVYAEIDGKDREEVDRIFNEALAGNNDDERELALYSSCMKLLLYLDRYSKVSTAAVTGVMGKAIDYINRNISLNISVESVCDAVNISKYHFCRQFKKHTGMTVMNYVLKTRIALAKSELVKTELPVSAISEKFGFSSVSYFCRVFRAEENCSPLRYRSKSR